MDSVSEKVTSFVNAAIYQIRAFTVRKGVLLQINATLNKTYVNTLNKLNWR